MNSRNNFYEALVTGGSHPISVRHVEPHELPHVQALHAMELPSHRSLSEVIGRHHGDHGATLAAFAGDKPVAAANVMPVVGEHGVYQIDSMITSPKFRGQGIGRQVILAAEAHAREAGAHTLTVEAHGETHDFFRRLGFDYVQQPSKPLEAGGVVTMLKPLSSRRD